MSSRVRLLALAALALQAACKGNVNNDVVRIAVTSRASVSEAGAQGTDASFYPSVSADGTLVAFQSYAQLHPLDTNSFPDVYVRDLRYGSTYLVSVSGTGAGAGNNSSYSPSISPDGRFVAFASYATNLQTPPATFDTNPLGGNTADIFIRDLWNDVTRVVSLNSGGLNTGNAASDGAPSVVATATDVYVAYSSYASNLHTTPAAVTDANTLSDIFLSRLSLPGLALQGTAFISHNSAGTAGGNSSSFPYRFYLAIDGAGTLATIVYTSYATDLQSASVVPDLNGTGDVFVRTIDLPAMTGGTTQLVSLTKDDTASAASWSGNATISADGSTVAWESNSADIVTDDTNSRSDIFVRTLSSPLSNQRVSLNSSGTQVTGDSYTPALSQTAQFVVFQSYATDLVPGDTNGASDVFLHDRSAGTTIRSSVRTFGAEAAGPSYNPAINGTGSVVVFQSFADNLVDGDTNFADDIFVRQY
jgi:hypothetical protein